MVRRDRSGSTETTTRRYGSWMPPASSILQAESTFTPIEQRLLALMSDAGVTAAIGVPQEPALDLDAALARALDVLEPLRVG